MSASGTTWVRPVVVKLQGAEDAAARAKAEGAHPLTIRAGLKRGTFASKLAMYECVRGRVSA